MKIFGIEKFFIYCGGGDIEVLVNNGIKTDVNKITGIGGAVFFTSIFATFSFGYAMSWVFTQAYICILLGLLWGAMIFNLDRLIVSGSLKTSVNLFSYYLNAVIRILLAIAISLIISVPLELKLFESLLLNESIKIEQKNSTEIKEMKQKITMLEKEYHYEVAGKGLTGFVGEGIVAKSGKQRILDSQNDLQTSMNNIAISFEKNKYKLGLLERYRALESLKKQDQNIMLISNAIILLFLLIEIIPVLLKVFSTDVLYEKTLIFKAEKTKKNFN